MSNVLELVAVTCEFPDGVGKRQALRDVDLTVSPGEMVAVMGPSGSGKSTLVNIACGLVNPTGGQVLIEGNSPPAWGGPWWAQQRRQRIGVVHQRHSLMDGLTAVDNVALPLELDGRPSAAANAAAQTALDSVGATALADRPAELLSIGQQQLVAIARGLVGNRPLLLADEPTAALDSNTAEGIVRLLAELASQGRAILLVTHDSRLASWADRVVRLRDGHVVEAS